MKSLFSIWMRYSYKMGCFEFQSWITLFTSFVRAIDVNPFTFQQWKDLIAYIGTRAFCEVKGW